MISNCRIEPDYGQQFISHVIAAFSVKGGTKKKKSRERGLPRPPLGGTVTQSNFEMVDSFET